MTNESPNSASRAAPTLGRDTAVMAIGTSLSRLTGVLRTFALAYVVGTLYLADAYNLANTIPNIVHDAVLGGVVSATFIPVFVERLSTRRDDEAWDAISAVVSVTLLVIGVATVAFLVLTPFIIRATTVFNHSSSAAQSRHVATDLLILFVPQLACYGFISLGTALLNAQRRFAAPMFAPIANNVVLIVMLLVFATLVRERSLAGVAAHRGQLLLLGLGTTLGVVVQAGLMIPSLRRAGLHLRWRPNIRHEAVRTILRLSGWTFGLVAANQIALLVVLAMSERVGRGAVSAYTYAYTFFQLPYGVAAVSIMAATAPELTARWATGDMVAFRRRMALGLRAMLAVIVPAAAGLLVLARPLVALLLGHGASNSSDTVATASSLAMLSLGLPGFCIFLYAIRVLQSIQDLRSAFWLYFLENGINIVFAVALAGPLGVRGIALSISIAYTLAAIAAVERVRERVHGLDAHLVARPLGRVLLSCAALVVAAALTSNVSAAQHGLGLLERVLLGVVAGAGAYFLTAGLLASFSTHRRGPPGGGRPDGPGGPPPTRPPARDEVSGQSADARERDGQDPPPRARRGAHLAPGPSGSRARRRWRSSRGGPPPPPEPLPPAGRPPIRPSRLGPTRRPGRDGR